MTKPIKDMTLEEWMTHSAEFAAKVFNDHGEVSLMWIAETKNNEIFPIVAPMVPGASKDDIANAVRKLFKDRGARRCITIMEAWTLMGRANDAASVAEIERHIGSGKSVKEHQDRRECIMVCGEDKSQSIMGMMFILRPEHDKPKLSPFKILEKMDYTEGRFARMLP